MIIGLEPGTLFAGRYEIIRRIGAGGMGAVYLACDPNDRKFEVALKLIYPGNLQSNQARERFRNEITASYRINHPNVVKAYEYFDAEDVQAYAMEYIDGGDLLARMREGTIAPDEAVLILKQIASALDAVHKAGIVHRDLKPENILLTRKGEIKLSDFGVARLKGAHTLTQAGSMVGTPKYLAPEYVETGECDGRGDIFAVGVLGYEMISGVSPFGKDFKPNNVLDRLTMHIPPLDKASRSCPPKLARIVEKAMSLKLVDRYQSAAKFLLDLENYESGKPLSFEGAAEDAPEPTVTEGAKAEVRSWEDTHSDFMAPLVETRGFKSTYEFEPQHENRHALTTWLAAGGVAAIFALAGVASFWVIHRPNPLQNLPAGIYKGLVSGQVTDGKEVPMAVWAYSDHVLMLFGKEGCAVAGLPRNGEYKCGNDKYVLTVGATTKRGASGTFERVGGNGASGAWNISNSSAPLTPPSAIVPVESEKVPPPPALAPQPAKENPVQPAPVAAAAAPVTPETQRLESLEAALKSGKITPEEAAKALLEMQNNGGKK